MPGDFQASYQENVGKILSLTLHLFQIHWVLNALIFCTNSANLGYYFEKLYTSASENMNLLFSELHHHPCSNFNVIIIDLYTNNRIKNDNIIIDPIQMKGKSQWHTSQHSTI